MADAEAVRVAAIRKIQNGENIHDVLRDSTERVGGADQKGRILCYTNERAEPPERNERRLQDNLVKNILRHHATVLYYLFRSRDYQPREVQVMRYRVEDGDAQFSFSLCSFSHFSFSHYSFSHFPSSSLCLPAFLS